MSEPSKVGIREFRENLSAYLSSEAPVAITRHGVTIGFYVPARHGEGEADIEALRRAGETLDALIEASGSAEDELVAEFTKARRAAAK